MPCEIPTSIETCSTPQTDSPRVDFISGDLTLSVAKDPAPNVLAETPVSAQVELSCTRCSKLAKSVRKLQKDNSYLRKRSRELKDQLKTVSR